MKMKMKKPFIDAPQMVACIASVTIGGATLPMWAFCGHLYVAC